MPGDLQHTVLRIGLLSYLMIDRPSKATHTTPPVPAHTYHNRTWTFLVCFALPHIHIPSSPLIHVHALSCHVIAICHYTPLRVLPPSLSCPPRSVLVRFLSHVYLYAHTPTLARYLAFFSALLLSLVTLRFVEIISHIGSVSFIYDASFFALVTSLFIVLL